MRLRKIAVTLIVVVLILVYSFNHAVYERGGYYSIVKKDTVNKNYYIYIQNEDYTVQLECSKKEFENIIVDNNLLYGIAYKGKLLNKTKGELVYLHLDDTIDDRNIS